jgi:hypothetical protein
MVADSIIVCTVLILILVEYFLRAQLQTSVWHVCIHMSHALATLIPERCVLKLVIITIFLGLVIYKQSLQRFWSKLS